MTTVTTVVVLILAAFAPYWMGWSSHVSRVTAELAAELTSEQQYPAFETVATTLHDKFTQSPDLTCKDATLRHPIEDTIKNCLNTATMDQTSLNVLFYGEAMLGKVCIGLVNCQLNDLLLDLHSENSLDLACFPRSAIILSLVQSHERV